MTRTLPPNASVTTHTQGAKLHAPAAERNVAALCEMLGAHAPSDGTALEIASGTGQHVSTFAVALPGLHWHPTDIDPARRASIDAHAADAGCANIAPAADLDATAPGWSASQGPRDLIVLINLLHLISMTQVTTLVAEAAAALAPHGTLVLYGPFKRGGALTSDGDARFDADLRAADPAIGYKDDLDILRLLKDAGLTPIEPVSMPANNLAFIARKVHP